MTVGPGDPVSMLMHEDVVSVDCGATLRELCETMVERGIGSVIVLEENLVAGIVPPRPTWWRPSPTAPTPTG